MHMLLDVVPPSNASTTLADFTSAGLILPSLCGRDVASVIQELAQAMQREKRVPDLLPFYEAALNREFLVSTDMEAGMAFPHARLPGLKALSFAFGRSDETLLWKARGLSAVRLVFLLAVPASDFPHVLTLISGLARLAKDTRLMESLQTAPDAFQILEVLKQVKLRGDSISNSTTRITNPGN